MADASTTTYSFTKPEVGASTDSWGGKLNANWDSVDDLLDGTTAISPQLSEGAWAVGATTVTATGAELNILDGVTATAAEINILDGVTATATEINYLDVTTLGTTEASKAVTADANGDVTFANSTIMTVETLSGTSVDLDPNAGPIKTHTLSGATTYTESLAEGEYVLLHITAGSNSITWPTTTWIGGSAPSLATGSDETVIVLWKVGSTLYGNKVGET